MPQTKKKDTKMKYVELTEAQHVIYKLAYDAGFDATDGIDMPITDATPDEGSNSQAWSMGWTDGDKDIKEDQGYYKADAERYADHYDQS